MAWCALFVGHPPVSHQADPTRGYVTACFPRPEKSSVFCSCASALHAGPCQASAFSHQERALCSPCASAWRANAPAEQHYPGADPCYLQANNTDPQTHSRKGIPTWHCLFPQSSSKAAPQHCPTLLSLRRSWQYVPTFVKSMPSAVGGIND